MACEQTLRPKVSHSTLSGVKFARVHTPCVSSLALSTCVVYSPNGLRFARLCRPSASIRVRTFWHRRYAAGNSLGHIPYLSSLALSTCGVYSPNGLRFAQLCRPSASIRVRTSNIGAQAAGNSLRYAICLSSCALSTCIVYSPNGLRFARLCRPSASIRVRTSNIGATRGKFARSRRSDFVAPLALKTRSFFWPTPPRQYLWLRT